jgi:hypothetical protein
MGHKGFSGSNIYLHVSSSSAIHIQRLSPENKGVSPYTALQAGFRSKKQGLTHLWLHATLLATSPQCYVTFFMFRFFKFHLPAMPSPPTPCPATLS